MRKISLLLLTLTICFFTACHKDIWAELDELDQRVTKLEELCKEMNTNITSLQAIVSVLQSNDYITGIVEIKKNGEVIGYTITFGTHDPITIYNGEDGADGSSVAPIIGVAQDTDGIYYWTLNGEWLLDEDGNKLPVTGNNGQNGLMPKLKIEEGYWYVSYDSGATWTQLGKATGEDGKDGADGKDGQNGDSMFQSVTQDENYVYFTLADGTVIKIAKGSGSLSDDDFIFTITYDSNGGDGIMEKDTFYYGQARKLSACTFIRKGFDFTYWTTKADGTGAIYNDSALLTIDRNITLYAQWFEEVYATFSISYDKKIVFSPGNLQYHPKNNEWRFAPNQWDFMGENNNHISASYDGWIDLFGWGTGSNPATTSTNDIYDYKYFTDWGKNEIGQDTANTWRTLTPSEYRYLMNNRNNASSLRGMAEVNGADGLIILPDNWDSLIDFKSFTIEEWRKLESLGAIFLPSAGWRTSSEWSGDRFYYWLNESLGNSSAYYGNTSTTEAMQRSAKLSVRLVKDIQ